MGTVESMQLGQKKAKNDAWGVNFSSSLEREKNSSLERVEGIWSTDRYLDTCGQDNTISTVHQIQRDRPEAGKLAAFNLSTRAVLAWFKNFFSVSRKPAMAYTRKSKKFNHDNLNSSITNVYILVHRSYPFLSQGCPFKVNTFPLSKANFANVCTYLYTSLFFFSP